MKWSVCNISHIFNVSGEEEEEVWVCVCVCSGFTGQRWWSSSFSPQTCSSCRWRWMFTLHWRRWTHFKRHSSISVLKLTVKTLVLQWMFLQLNPSWDGPIKQLLADADAWLCKRRTGTETAPSHLCFFFLRSAYRCLALVVVEPTDLCEKEPFLNTEDGASFSSVFKHVRLQYIINDLASARNLERDNILPPGENWE